jgi:hypothetical protein
MMKDAKLDPVRPELNTLLDAAMQTGGETHAFDFKELLDVRDDAHRIRLVRAVAAFGNTDAGGHIWIGITDDRKIVGLTDEIAGLYDQTPIQSIVNTNLAPPPAIQVRHHERDGKKLVVIEVSPFREVPCIVKQTVTARKEKLVAGTILFRNASAESAVLSTELDMRKLCEAIANRRATSIVELIQRGLVGDTRVLPSRQGHDGLNVLRRRADEYWGPNSPYLEVYFTPERNLGLSGADLATIIPAACVPIRHGFPFHAVNGFEVHTTMAWGWLGIIPFSDKSNPADAPSYLWLFGRDGSFLDREGFWEDNEQSVIPGGVGLHHVLGDLITLVRFLDRAGSLLKIPETTRFTVGVALHGVEGRYMEDEKSPGGKPFRRKTTEPRIEAQAEVSISSLRSAREEVVVNLLEEVAWQFRRDDWKRQDLVNVVQMAPKHLGPQYAFPAKESV